MRQGVRRLVRILKVVAVALVVLATAGAGFIYWYDSVGQRPDRSFDTSVAAPTYPAEHPQVLFDVAHRNFHTPTGRYEPFAQLLTHDGYTIVENRAAFTAEALAGARVLVIANAMGPDDHEGHDAFTAAECDAVAAWVRGGGSLLLIADHVPFGSAASSLAARFGVELYLAFARDDDHHAGWDNERLEFTGPLLADHPITRGRTAAERLTRVVTFTGESLSVPAGATPILALSDVAYDWESRSVRHPARGHAQAIAMPFGAGRVVILGEAGVLSAQVDPLGFKMGMSYDHTSDRQLALNIAHWLSHAI
jgi:hypothetical protein